LTGKAFNELLQRLRAHLGQDRRYAHSVRVARCAELLAQRHTIDTHKARLAGLLHDLARLYSSAELIAQCEARGMPIAAYERDHPTLLHARLGAVIARESFGVTDPEVLSAIEKHTTAAAEMSPLDACVYLADSLEPGRTFPERAALWTLALHDLRAAMREVLLLTFAHLARKGQPAAPPSLAAARCFGLTGPQATEEARASAS
jgi:predicted HD superfamily hydrolase involved in NAD metabolism